MSGALVAISIPSLSPKDTDDTNQLLWHLVSSINSSVPQPASFESTPTAVRDNILFSISLLFSVFAAFGAVLGKQWLIYYTRITPNISDKDETVERLAKIKGAATWQLQLLLEMALPSLLQLSLVLFTIALVDSFWNIHSTLGIWTFSFAVTAFSLFFTTVVLSIRYPSCPFQTPISRIAWPTIRKLLIPLTKHIPEAKPNRSFKSIRRWSKGPAPPFGLDDVEFGNLLRDIGPDKLSETTSWSIELRDRGEESIVQLDDTTKLVSQPNFLRGGPIYNCIDFTIRHTNGPDGVVPVAHILPSFSKALTRFFASDYGRAFADLFWQAMAQLDREAQLRPDPKTIFPVLLFTRAMAHLYVAEAKIEGLDWDDWWEKVEKKVDPDGGAGHLALVETEMAHLLAISTSTSRKRNRKRRLTTLRLPHSPLPHRTYLGAALMRSAAQPNNSTRASAFVSLAAMALSQEGIEWGSIILSIEGLRRIIDVFGAIRGSVSNYPEFGSSELPQWYPIKPSVPIFGKSGIFDLYQNPTNK